VARAEELFDRLTRLAARTLDAPVALLSLVHDDQQLVCSAVGLGDVLSPPHELPLPHFLVDRVIAADRPVGIGDLREEPLAGAAPPLAELGLVSLLATPLRRGDRAVGILVVLDRRPRHWLEADAQAMLDLSGVAMVEIQARTQSEGLRRTERALQKSEGRFRSLIENASDLITVLSAGGTVDYVTPSVQRALGYAPEELVGQNAFALLHPDDAPAVIAQFSALSRGAECAGSLDCRVRHHDGSWRTFEVKANNLLHAPGVAGVVINARDITDAKEAKDTRRRLNAFLEATPDFVATFDPHGRALSINTAFRRVLGIGAADDLSTLTLADLFPPAATERVLHEGIPTANREGIWSGETALLAHDGTRIPISQVILAHRASGGALEFLSTLGRDITEQKRAEELLRSSEEYFRSLIENSLDIITILDAEGVVQFESPSVRRVLGYDPEEVMGRAVFDLIHPDDMARLRRVFQRGLRNEDLMSPWEYRCRHQDGSWRVLECVGENLLDVPAVGGVVVHSRDVSERKVAESALRESQEQLLQSQKMEAVGRLAGGIAHDFNNLLTAIKGFTELLMLDLDERDPRHGFVQEIQSAAGRAAGLTRQLLAFSRKQVLQPRVLDLNASVADMEKMLRRLIGEDVQLETMLRPRVGHVRADPSQVEQVLVNLAVNARDAMPVGGRLRIETADAQLPAELLPVDATEPPGPFVLLTVSDTGTGMSPEVQARIFEPFFTTKGQGKGTGLGLATVYGIVNQSGGFVAVESEKGLGTTFRVYLPRVEEAAERATERPALARPSTGTETVLVTEDEPAVRVLVRRVLDRHGYRVLEAESGAQALELLESYPGPVHLLLTDVVMPGMSGRELADRLVPRFPQMRVLYMSGYTDEAIVRHGVLDPGIALLEKPFTPDVMLRKIRDVLDSAR
jgi:two-component system cell cycle sensor histidine kinase/response regulator CckA